MPPERTCSRCGHPGLTGECPTCVTEWENRRDAEEMTPEERLEEFRSWGGILEIEFPKVHERMSELVGRPVFSHELASSAIPYLEHEIMTGERPSLDGILAKFPDGKPVITVEVDPDGNR